MYVAVTEANWRRNAHHLPRKHVSVTAITEGGTTTHLHLSQEETAFEQRVGTMIAASRRWLEYDSVALAVLFIAIGSLVLVVLSI
jgi:hypothetical protein